MIDAADCAAPAHAFTVDVEDWFDGIPRVVADAPTRLASSLACLLDLLAEHKARATLFWLGPAAKRVPDLLRRAAAEGHEIGCHGWSHRLIYDMSPAEFRSETIAARACLEDLAGVAVEGYRAAYFSITSRSWWALEVLAELGFSYDSSVFPVKNWRYGVEDFRPTPQLISTSAGNIWEIPLSVVRRWGRNLPVGGGAYFRIYPYALTRSNFQQFTRRNVPAVFYIHPWELDPQHPRVRFNARPWITHYANLSSTLPKLKKLLTDFNFKPLREVVGREAAATS